MYRSFPNSADSDSDSVDDPFDEFPLDAACQGADQGFDPVSRPQCYASWLAEQQRPENITYIESLSSEEVVLHSSAWDSIIRFDYSGALLEDLKYKSHIDVSGQSIKFVAFDASLDRLYLLNSSNELIGVNLGDGSFITAVSLSPLPSLPVQAVKALNNGFILVQEGAGETSSISLHNLTTGARIQSASIANIDLENAVWSDKLDRLYAFTALDGVVQKLLYMPIDVASGTPFGLLVESSDVLDVPASALTIDPGSDFDGSVDDKVVLSSGFVFSQALDTKVALDDPAYLGSDFKAGVSELFVRHQSETGKSGADERVNGNNEVYYVSLYSDESDLTGSQSVDRPNSIQVFVQAERDGALISRSLEYLPATSANEIWALIPRKNGSDNDLLQISRNNRVVSFDRVGIQYVDAASPNVPCFYRKRFDLVDSDDCAAVSASTEGGRFADADGDSLVNLEEYDYLTDLNNEDTDGDGWGDFYETERGTDPLDPADF